MVGGNVDTSWRGSQVGAIDLQFSGGQVLTIPLIAWANLEEAWGYESEMSTKFQMPDNSGCACRWGHVWQEHQTRGGLPAIGFMDMISITVPPDLQAETLQAFTISDARAGQGLNLDIQSATLMSRSDVTVATSNPAVSAPPVTYATPNGPKTEQQMRDELQVAGYGGPWDVLSVLSTYTRVTAAPPPPSPVQAGSAPGAVPAPAAPAAPSFIAASDAWIEGGLRLIANEPHNEDRWTGNCWCGNGPTSSFRIENRTGSTLNFGVDKSVFSLQLSSGRKYSAHDINGNIPGESRTSVIVDNLGDGAGQDFYVTWGWDTQDWNAWQADLRNSGVTYYEMSATGFTSRIHNAKWRKDITH